jgi:hypothetical protein
VQQLSDLDLFFILPHDEQENVPHHAALPQGYCTCGEKLEYRQSEILGLTYVAQHYDTEHVPTTIPIEHREREAEEKPKVEIPAPTIPQRDLDPAKALKERTFPIGPKRAWKAALEAGHAARATYAVGPYMSANFQSILEPDCPTIALWVIRKGDGMRMRALWICRGGKWSFEHAWELGILPLRLNSKEMMTWLTK